jgi:hypothetical protein
MINVSRLLAAILIMTCAARSAHAQTDNRLAVGGSVTSRIGGGGGADASSSVGFDWRIGHGHEGWGVEHSIFSWYDIGVEPDQPRSDRLGSLRVRPLMVGYGYTWIRGRAAFTPGVLGGLAFNSFHVDKAVEADYQTRLGARNVHGEATNTFVVKPQVQVWYDLNRRFGVKLNGGYLVSRPTLTVVSSLGRDSRSFKADTFLITVAIVYSII